MGEEEKEKEDDEESVCHSSEFKLPASLELVKKYARARLPLGFGGKKSSEQFKTPFFVAGRKKAQLGLGRF